LDLGVGGIVDYLVFADLLGTTYRLAGHLHFQLGDITKDTQPVIADGHVDGVHALLPHSADVHPRLVLLSNYLQVTLFSLIVELDQDLLVALLFPLDIYLDVFVKP
jgi:hypothetical protein